MMRTAPPLLLTCEQAKRLLWYMQEYRRATLTTMPPTQERNVVLRLVQALQGKLLILCDQEQQIQLLLTREEVAALKAMAKSLLLLYGEKTADSSDRRMTVTDVGNWYAYLKHTYG